MNNFDRELTERLGALRARGLHRELRRVDSQQSSRIKIGGKTLLNFSSNDYLGLANDPILKEAAIQAVETFGAGSGASRLICGSLAPHHELEEALADFKGAEAALSFSTGYATAIGTICALLGRDDVIVLDKLVHACIVDAARLSGAKIRVFAHNDMNALEKILKWTRRGELCETQTKLGTRVTHPSEKQHTLIVTESVFSMDGDAAPLREIVALKEKHGAWLMVDEAHATGLYGKNRRGLAEEFGVSDRIEIQMGTLGKAVGASGGYICSSRPLIDFLINRARSFIFSTAPVPAAAAAATAGVRFIQSKAGEGRRNQLFERINELNSKSAIRNPQLKSAIIPVLIGDETRAVAVSAALREQGIFVPAIRYPTVARGAARLRVTVTATHTVEDISMLVAALRSVRNSDKSRARDESRCPQSANE
ncbi:MAG: 8-amino-7-oxononanoate synthase [Verrucomicrobiota bacterium]|jgi:8-amino-7-oxononanoate synthase